MHLFLNLRSWIFGIIGAGLFFPCQAQEKNGNNQSLKKGLIGYWKLSGDINDVSGNNLQTVMHGGIDVNEEGHAGKRFSSARFNGRNTWLEIPATTKTQLGGEDFSISAWIYTKEALDDVTGDIISQYDPSSRRGFQLSLKCNSVCTNTANFRQLNFGIWKTR